MLSTDIISTLDIQPHSNSFFLQGTFSLSLSVLYFREACGYGSLMSLGSIRVACRVLPSGRENCVRQRKREREREREKERTLCTGRGCSVSYWQNMEQSCSLTSWSFNSGVQNRQWPNYTAEQTHNLVKHVQRWPHVVSDWQSRL